MVQINNSNLPYLNFFDKGGMKLQNAAATRSIADDKFFMFNGRIPANIL